MLKKKYIYFITVILLPIIVVINYFLNNKLQTEFWVKIVVILSSFALSLISIVFYKIKNTFWQRLTFLGNIILCVAVSVLSIFSSYDLLYVFSSIASFKEFILSTKEMGMIIYVLVQMGQVMLLPIPSMIITLAGVAIYGPLLGSLLCSAGVLAGSYASFFIGKTFGFKLVSWVAGKESATKYADIINKRGKFFLIIAFLLPLFPDDILCLIAGITTMKFKHFFWIASITRPIGVICMSYFGGGYIIPFSGWGLYVWPFILLLAIVAVVVSTKYQPQMEKWIIDKLYKFNFSKKNKSKNT